MAINLSNLGSKTKGKKIDPREIFMALPYKNKKFEYPRDVQSEVWKQWYEQRNNRDCILKMNTGSGKTVVALLILQSCLNENKGPAVYVVPDSYLVSQVIEQAAQLGIATTTDEKSIDFLRGRAILVINVHTLVNGKSKFGMREYNNVEFKSVIIDDVHACIATVQSQFKIYIDRKNDAYMDFVKLFIKELKSQSESKIMDILSEQNPYGNMLVPFWVWQDNISDIIKIINEARASDTNIDFSADLIIDSLKQCRGYISAEGIEIVPNCIPIHKIKSLEEAERRIYLSATLPDDSIFSTTLDVDLEKIGTIICPEKANDIGERLIVVPKLIDSSIQDFEIRDYAVKMSKKINVVVLSPSLKNASAWEDLGGFIIKSSNMQVGIKKIKSSLNGLYVLLNKYDGIDLPDEACRMLIIDGLPNIMNMNDRYEKSIANQSDRILKERIQKIEQGMGRGIRSSSDYCIVYLMGNELTDAIYSNKAYNYFSEATKAQYLLSEEICDSADNFEEIIELTDKVLNRDQEWVSLCKDNVADIVYSKNVNYNKLIVANRKAYNLCEVGRIQEATIIMLEEANHIDDLVLKGYYEQQRAEYVNMYDKKAAQELMISAKSKNRYLLNPIVGIQQKKLINKLVSQSRGVVTYIEKNKMEADSNLYVLHTREILDNLVFEKDTHEAFEESIKEVLNLIGFSANRPEKETGIGPDDFCIASEKDYLVIECKNEAVTDKICKHDCEQLLGSRNWFREMYPANFSVPILIHNSYIFDKDCFPSEDTRIITPYLLEKLKSNVQDFCTALCKKENYMIEEKIEGLIKYYNLEGRNFVNNYTRKYKK